MKYSRAMKQILLTLVITLLSVGASAWDFTENLQKETVSIDAKELIGQNAIKQYSTHGHFTAYKVLDQNTGIRVDNGIYAVMRLPDGVFVGEAMSSSTKTGDYNINIIVNNFRCLPISKATITYYPINSDNTYKCINNGYTLTDKALTTSGGKQYRQAVFTYKYPAEVLMIKTGDEGTWDKTSVYATDFGYAMRGIVITKIEIEYVKDYEVYNVMDKFIQDTKSQFVAAQNASANGQLINQINQYEQFAYDSRYKAAAGGDVNEDGQVNAADIVNIYNTIAEGPSSTDMYNGHRYVDLGLPSGILWAECNLGANVPEGLGDYFAWAGNDGSLLSGKMPFSADSYHSDLAESFYAQEANTMLTYLPPTNSSLYKNSWNGWNVPSLKNCKELLDNCTAELKYLNGVLGTLFTSKTNHKSIFFPHGGYIDGNKLKDVSSTGTYWTGTPLSAGKASILRTNSFNSTTEEVARHTGRPIRCVLPKSAIK